MKREGGWTAAFLVGIAATVGVSSFQTKPSSDLATTRKSIESRTTAAATAKKAIEKGPCADLETRLQTFFLVRAEEVAAPDSCFPNEKPPAKSGQLQDEAKSLRFVIATLPDPLHTHFPLIFDRTAEAVQQAAQDRHYVYDSSWLPWETEQVPYARIDDLDEAERRKALQEDQPGMLIFRGSLDEGHPLKNGPVLLDQGRHPFQNGLVVLIVGEEPTGGIHRRQFENAVAWIEALQPRAGRTQPLPYPVQLLGPSFSGSLPSLVQLLGETAVAKTLHPDPGTALQIYSGNVTSNIAVNWLKTEINQAPLNALDIQFRSFQQSDNVVLDQYCRYLIAIGSDLDRLAVVSEDETAFGGEYAEGNSGTSPCYLQIGPHSPIYLYYPRDISALRAAYQSQSIFSRSVAQPSADTLRHTLQTDLADPEGKQHDTIRSYSGNQTALSQEAELQQIVSLLRAHRTEYILLRSSNPLDQLFLSHFLRLAYPEGRIVIQGADLLLRRETGVSGLNGIMTLSTYPLLPWGQDWTGPDKPKHDPPDKSKFFHSHRVFTHDEAEGTYVAARFLLHDAAAASVAVSENRSCSSNSWFVPPNRDVNFNLRDYALPFWMKEARDQSCRHPPTWLSVLGNGGFWPVAAMDFTVAPGSEAATPIAALGENVTFTDRVLNSFTSVGKSILFFLNLKTNAAANGGDEQGWLDMPLSMKFFMLAILVWAGFHAFCCWRPSITVKPGHRAHFVRPRTGADFVQTVHYSHLALILFGSVLVALVAIALAWGYGEMSETGEPLPNPWPYRAFLPTIWLIAGFSVCANAWVEAYLRNPASANQERPVMRFRKWDKKPMVPKVVWESFLAYLGVSFALYWLLDFSLEGALNETNRIPTYWRSMNLLTGVSPLVPLLALTVGLYGWFWYSLQGLALFGEDRPLLPDAHRLKVLRLNKPHDDLLRMLSREWAANPIERLSAPFAPLVWIIAAISFVALVGVTWLLSADMPIRSLGSKNYSFVFCAWLALCISILLASAWQLSHIWLKLRHMLLFLDKLPLRRTLEALKGFSWGSVWRMSGSVLDLRYKLIFRQLESLTHLRGSLLDWEQLRLEAAAKAKATAGVKADYQAEADPAASGEQQHDDKKTEAAALYEQMRRGTNFPSACPWVEAIEETRRARVEFALWYSEHWDDWAARDVSKLRVVQERLADMAAMMLTQLLIPTWREERESLVLNLAPAAESDPGKDKGVLSQHPVARVGAHIRNAEELVCLVYLGFVQNILGRMRSITMGIICIFIAITIAISSYPFDPRPVLSGAVIALFVILGAVIVVVYSQMHRDATLSNLTNTKPGELGTEFWFKLVGFGIGPLLGLVTSVFPEFTGFLFSWLQPSFASMK